MKRESSGLGRSLGPGLVPILATILLVGCDKSPTPTDPGGQSLQTQSASDSTEIVTLSHTPGPGLIPIHAGDSALITVTGAMSARCENIAVSGVINVSPLITSIGGCGGGESDGVGQTATIGPAASDGDLRFFISTSPAAVEQVSGASPNFVVAMDDGLFDFDFDDVVISVQIMPAQPESCPQDPWFEDPQVVSDLTNLWNQTNANGPAAGRVETGAWIRETPGGGFEVVPIENDNPDACTFSPGLVDVFINTVGFVHTHAFASGEIVPAGLCVKFPLGGEVLRGPSEGDRETARFLNEVSGSEITDYIFDPDGILRYDVDENGFVSSIEAFGKCGIIN